MVLFYESSLYSGRSAEFSICIYNKVMGSVNPLTVLLTVIVAYNVHLGSSLSCVGGSKKTDTPKPTLNCCKSGRVGVGLCPGEVACSLVEGQFCGGPWSKNKCPK